MKLTFVLLFSTFAYSAIASKCDILYSENDIKYQLFKDGKPVGQRSTELKDILDLSNKMVSEKECEPLEPEFCDIFYEYLFYNYQLVRGDRAFGIRTKNLKDSLILLDEHEKNHLCKKIPPESVEIMHLKINKDRPSEISKQLPVYDSSKPKVIESDYSSGAINPSKALDK